MAAVAVDSQDRVYLFTRGDAAVLVYERDGDEDQVTVVTETHGPLAGHRVVRGLEDECRVHYAAA